MKFLTCSRCFSVDANGQASGQPVQEITNPLVVTKRPVPKVLHPPSESSPSPPRKRRFPAILSALTSWPRRRQPRKHRQRPSPKSVRKTVRVIEPPPRVQRTRHRLATRTQRLIKHYEERANSPESCRSQFNEEFLIDPPASFSGDDSIESHQNFRNKLNTLDFKRMNTVALEAPVSPTPSRTDSAIYRKNSYSEVAESAAVPICKFARKTLLEDFLKERVRIEQTMIDLLNGRDPGSILLKKSRNEDKRVRFSEEAQQPQQQPKELRVDLGSEGKIELRDDGRLERETEIKLCVDPSTKVEDFYVEKRTTYLKDKTVEDKALVLKIGKEAEQRQQLRRRDVEDTIGRAQSREMVFRDFGKMNL